MPVHRVKPTMTGHPNEARLRSPYEVRGMIPSCSFSQILPPILSADRPGDAERIRLETMATRWPLSGRTRWSVRYWV